MTRFAFTIRATDGKARTGTIQMNRGEIRTPAFMPVGTAATVKAMKPEAVRATGADIILGKVDGVEIRDFHSPTLNSYGVAEWYRFLNLGYHVAAVGGTDKMSAGMPVPDPP